jgi:hypothetical protein
MVPERHEPALVNLEWWTVGRLSALLGRRPALAYRLFGLAATLALVAAVDGLLARRGLGPARRLPALLLVFTGAGLGGILLRAGVPGQRCLDLTTGLFPFIETLANPHFTVATLLLLLALVAFAEDRVRAGLLWGTALGLVRPYDLGLLLAARALGVALTRPPAAWGPALAPMAGLAPVLAYNYWLFLRDARFAIYSSATYVMPPPFDFLPALAPAALVAAVTWRPPAAHTPTRATELHLVAWAASAAVVALARLVPFPLQFMVGMGLPLLLLAAIGLAVRPAWVTWATVAALCPTAVVATLLVWGPNPRWHVPRERIEAARLLRPACGPDDLALAPPDIGLYAAGLTACRVFVGHAAAQGYAEREAQARAFYGAADPAWRTAFLDAAGITRLVLPGEPGPVPAAWLGDATAFRHLAQAGEGAGAISVYVRGASVPRSTR